MQELRKLHTLAALGSSLECSPSAGPADLEINFLDPLDADLPSDLAMTLSHRQLSRLMFIAAETGARFEREGVDVDPVGWLFTPRVLFDGRQALVACKEREAFIRAILLHGLSIGFDADPDEMDALMAEHADKDCNELPEEKPKAATLTAVGAMAAV